MRVLDLILKKKQGLYLTREELQFLIQGYVENRIPDYQMSAFLMAVCFAGMTGDETGHLTDVMVHSGKVLDLSDLPGIKVDKHSTGGVGDTTTLVLAPLVAAAGLRVAKLSGRGLGHTGGTLDKLESIPGLTTSVETEQFIRQVNEIGVAVAAQTGDLVPADKKLYALRDVTATVDCVPLIASSIMSKKIASGADRIVLDTKCGSGAFMKKKEDAVLLARTMVEIGEAMGRQTIALVTDMDQPLGNYIGNALEVLEAIEILTGKITGGALREVSLELGAQMLVLGEEVPDARAGRRILEDVLTSGAGARKLEQLIEAQKGNPRVVSDPSLLPQAAHREGLPSRVEGYVQAIDAEAIGRATMVLGAGRERKEDVIDPAVGLVLQKRCNESIRAGESLVTFFTNDVSRLVAARKIAESAFKIGPEPLADRPLIHEKIEGGTVASH
ncbi:MAG: thymidine phosphorylase [Armatimonadetes bacterium]|nr:thymidine phosphorylase [Armatimonadota bacterium]